MGKALYRKYRSRKLSEIVGQDHVTSLLKNALKSNRISHAYLFTGPRGVGKTSIARILAHEINKLPYTDESSHLDIIEIDAASNNGVDDIRELRERASLAPTSAEKKVYIIDEVHMLSKQAFNALLKTLEEPPEHVVFILATTDVEKLPDTIISRTQRHTFRLASETDIIKNLKKIVEKENIKIDDSALQLIASQSLGSFRDSVALLDQLANLQTDKKSITADIIENSLGLAPKKQIIRLFDAIRGTDFDKTAKILKELDLAGIQAKVVASQLIELIRDNLTDTPTLADLLDALIDVSKSPLPDVKLLASLGHYITSQKPLKPSSVATSVSLTEPVVIREQLPELAKKAHQKLPKDDIVTSSNKRTVIKQSTQNVIFQEKKLLDETKKTNIGIFSILKQSSFVFDDTTDTLTIYAKNTFNKKRLETSANLRIIHELVDKLIGKSLQISIIPSSKPLDNSQVATAFAIMGGGEEVDLMDQES